jgi:hypothetical protein
MEVKGKADKNKSRMRRKNREREEGLHKIYELKIKNQLVLINVRDFLMEGKIISTLSSTLLQV